MRMIKIIVFHYKEVDFARVIDFIRFVEEDSFIIYFGGWDDCG